MTPIAEWVDLGLPSGTLWRRMNLGADQPHEAGLYFSWGNTDGHTPGDGYEFTAESYAVTPGASLAHDLQPINDCCAAALGDGWRLPSVSEFRELIDCCEQSVVEIDGHRCFRLQRGEKFLLLPLAGLMGSSGLANYNQQLFTWSSSYNSQDNSYALNSPPDNERLQLTPTVRRAGKSARAVRITLHTPLSLVIEQCMASSSSFYGNYIAFGVAGTLRYLIADWKTPSGDPGNEYGCRVFSNLADIDNPESAALPANQIYITQAGEDAASLAAFIGYYNEDNPKPIAGVISGGSAMSLIEGLLISPTAPV